MADRIVDKEGLRRNPNLGSAMKARFKALNLQPELDGIKQEVLNDAQIQKFLQGNANVIAQTIIDRDFAVLYEFFEQKHQRGDALVHPGYRPVLALSDGQIVILYQPDEETVTRKKLAIQSRLVSAIGMPKNIQRADLNHYLDGSQDNTGRLAAYSGVVDFVGNYIDRPGEFQRGLFIHGSYGIGKTYLMGAMANALAGLGVPVTLMHFPTFANELKNTLKDNMTGEKVKAIEEAPILVLDDIGAESLSAWVRDDILGVILEYRMQNELPTFFTSNFSMEQLQNEHLANTKDGYEPVKAERLMQRIQFLAKEVTMTGENRRLN